MVSKITELKTNDGEITLGELIRFLMSTPEFKVKQLSDTFLSLTEHSHDVDSLNGADKLVKRNEFKVALDEFDSAVADALNDLEKRIDIPFLRAQVKALQDKPDFDASKIEAKLKELEQRKPESKTTVVQNYDKTRIDSIEKKQGEVVTLLGKIIDDANLKVEDLRKEIAEEISRKIKKDGKHVNIIGGVGGVNKLKLLFDVNVEGVTNGQTIVWNATSEKWEAGSGGDTSNLVPYAGATAPLDMGAFDAAANLFTSSSGQYNFTDGVLGEGNLLLTGGEYSFLNADGNPPRVYMGSLALWNTINEAYGEIALEDTAYIFSEGGSPSDIKISKLFLHDLLSPSTFGELRFEDESFLFGETGTSSITAGVSYLSQIYAGAGTAVNPSYGFTGGSNGMYLSGTNQISFSTSGTQHWTISSAGNLNAVGTKTMAASLIHSAGVSGSAAAPIFSFGFGLDTDTGMYRAGADTLGFSTGGTERLRIGATNGQVGINRSSGQVGMLDVVTAGALADTVPSIVAGKAVTSGNALGASFRNFTGTTGNTYVEIAGLNSGNARTVQLRTDSNGDFGVFTGSTGFGSIGTERVTVKSTGNVLIGTTTDVTAYGGAKLQVKGSGSASSTWYGRIISGGDANVFLMGQLNGVAQLGGHDAALSGWADIYINSGGGNVKIGAGTPNSKLDVTGTVQCDGLRLDVTPTVEIIVPTATITISVNGTNYKIPIVAA